ncbi:hypothetical protein [Aliikangiella sp. G2MR2-5]|uniref:HvfA family oxazolone/thioamide-modified RiPP metallophore n=1 Tax=Aliikangiella sp. G2MR2-5 TaxID=2788943 RepID=UPI0018AA99EA|nr:hypothetical protein [Aliikangiella sp. G2MR2-5]
MKKLTKIAAIISSLMMAALFMNTASADANPFAQNDQIQTIAGDDGKCGDSKKEKKEGKCGEGKCGEGKKDKKEGKCGEGKCGEGKKGHKEGKCGEGKKERKEGKCGEGKKEEKEGKCGDH